MTAIRAPLFTALLIAAAGSVQAEPPRLAVEPETVVLGLLRSGNIEASAPVVPGSRAIFRLEGPSQRLLVRRRQRIGGLLWVERDERVVAAIPAIHLVHGWPRAAAAEDLRAHGLVAHVEHPDILDAKRVAGLYGEDDSPREAREGRAIATFRLPDTAPPGEYRLSVHILTGPRVAWSDSRRISVRRSAVASTAERLARDHGLLYGVAAALLALGLGLLAGLLRGLGTRLP